MTYKTFRGPEIETIFDDLARLRITVFKEYPYLYEGTFEYEKDYLKIYSISERSLVFTVYEGEKMIGATTCIPLAEESEEVRKPFQDAGMDINSIFYFGESILLQSFRGMGIGNRFFDERENHVRNLGGYSMTCFCSVVRPNNHPLKPREYQPHDKFWTKRGYQKNESLQSEFGWLDINESKSALKPMIYWTKKI